MIDKIIVDADFCIKLGGSDKYHFLFEVIPLLANEILMHRQAYDEVKFPNSAIDQLNQLIEEGYVRIVNQNDLDINVRTVYDMTYSKLARVMINPQKPNKNKGEVCSLAYAKATSIPIFATDEAHLQSIIDSQLNVGVEDIKCVRIKNVVEMIRDGQIDLSRKYAKAMWRISYNNGEVNNANQIFDDEIWPILN